MVKAIFFDIDGTLRGFNQKGISDDTRHALDRARKAGIRLFIATGRHFLEVDSEDLLDGLEFDAYITLNGQYCYEGTPGRPVIDKNPIPRSQIAILLKILEETPFPCLFMEAENWYLNFVDERVIRVQDGIGTRIPPLGDPGQALEHDIYQVIPYLNEKEAVRLAACLPECGYTVWHDGEGVDLTPKGGGKCSGIREVIARYGIKPEEMAAIGDGNNDVSMLAYAGIGIAMGNGTRKAIEAADHVTGSVSEGGLAQAVDYLLSMQNSPLERE